MKRFDVVKEGDGIMHYSHGVDPSNIPADVVRTVCDGKHWYLYQATDIIPPQHEHQEPEPEASSETASGSRWPGRPL